MIQDNLQFCHYVHLLGAVAIEEFEDNFRVWPPKEDSNNLMKKMMFGPCPAHGPPEVCIGRTAGEGATGIVNRSGYRMKKCTTIQPYGGFLK